MDGGQLNAFGGRVELGGLVSAGTVALNGDGNNLSLSFPNSVARSDVSLSNGAVVNVLASDGGSIAVNARNLEMTQGSELLAGIDSGLGSNNSKAGNIAVNATGAINLNNASAINNLVQEEANGQGGDVNISASTLRLEGGAQVNTTTLGAGKGGFLRVDAQDVQLIGTSADNQFYSGLAASAQRNSTGDAGDLTIKTHTLLVRDGAQVQTVTFAAGKGGSLRVDAQDVQIIGESADGQINSALGASAQQNSTGDAGDLTIKTNTLLVRDGAVVVTGTSGTGNGGSLKVDAQDVQIIGTTADPQFPTSLFASAGQNSTGNAGDLTIKTNTLLVRDGAQVSAGTLGAGNGGFLRVDAQDVQIIGTSANGQLSSSLVASAEQNSTGHAGSLTIKTNTLLVRDGAQVSAATFGAGKGGSLSIDAQNVGIIGTSVDGRTGSVLVVGAAPNSTGNAGDLTLKTNTLLQDRSVVTVENRGTGTAGNLFIDANQIYLNNTGRIRADTSGGGGNINLRSSLILLRNGSSITTNARGSNIPGGNIRIDTDNLVAVPKENSDITANSENFRGGNITVTASGIFGIDFREQVTPLSDITATGVSEEFSGTVELITPGIDPARGLAQLPTEVVDASDEIAQGCPAAEGNSFVVTGRGGLPPTPEQQLDDDAEWLDRRRLTVAQQTPHPTSHTPRDRISNARSHTPIIEATGWQMTPTGKVILFASTPDSTVPHSLNQPVTCPGRQ